MKVYYKGSDNYSKKPRRCDRYRRRSKIKKVKVKCLCCGRWIKLPVTEVVAKTEDTPLYQRRGSYCACSRCSSRFQYVQNT